MTQALPSSALSESRFAELVDALGDDPARGGELTGFLREDHSIYEQRGAAAIVRMRAWVFIALARAELQDEGLVFVLEELETGQHAYLVAAAARALRACTSRNAAFAPFVMRAITNIKYHDEPVSFDRYGEYATAAVGVTAVQELLITLAWLGPQARAIVPGLKTLSADHGLSKRLRREAEHTLRAIEDEGGGEPGENAVPCCALPIGRGAFSWARGSRRGCDTITSTVFEDQDGAFISFDEFFRGRPSIVVFFYTRCDNPQKCSLTVAKLARLQTMLADRGLAGRVRTAAITYDPAFDRPERLRAYGRSRGLCMDADHRMLRTTGDIAALRSHFGLGVNFVESLVNRHRIEVYLLDAAGAIAASFERLHWQEEAVVDRSVQLARESHRPATEHLEALENAAAAPAMTAGFGTLASAVVAFFPKCPACWAAYMSVSGVTFLERLQLSPWLQPALGALIAVNVVMVWMRARTTGRYGGLWLAAAGALAIIVSKIVGAKYAGGAGVALTLAGSLLSARFRAAHAAVDRPRSATNVSPSRVSAPS